MTMYNSKQIKRKRHLLIKIIPHFLELKNSGKLFQTRRLGDNIKQSAEIRIIHGIR